ncbi:MAG TPA: class I SAM-dependent methyltransferase [Sphingomicrobium sp.]|nr:class I SAM-dependent methyltransferase [Sphingomicrobium sp.]
MKDVSDIVARQYEAFAYPEPFADIEAEIAKGYFQVGDPSLYAPVLWPRGRPERPLRILVAGCGTVQAAYLAYRNCGDEVVGIDLSEASLAHERFLQERHGLSNLRLYRGNLMDAPELGTFDVIACSGVLHHMAEPDAGLAALRDALAEDGVMVLMVYGQTMRVGVYMLQEAFRRIGVTQSSDGVAQVRAILRELPDRHCVRPYVRAADELRHDTAIVDTFLHPQDRAYTVPQIFDFLEGAGMRFQNWLDGHHYWRNGRWGPDSAVAAAVDPLPPREHWAAVEMLDQTLGMHIFTAVHADREVAEVDFEHSDWRSFTPHPAPAFSRLGRGLFRRGAYELRCTELEHFVIDGADGSRTIGEIIDVPALEQIPQAEREEFARRFFEHLWKLGHMMIALPAR